jgi:hypothetical protein
MSRQRAAGSGQERAATAGRPLPTARFIINLVWQFAVPGLALLFFAYRDRYDGKPDYVVPWLLFAAVIGAAWTIPIARRSRHRSFSFIMPMWIWPWLALAGVLLHRQ